jgi:hypothetical protein
VNDVEIRPWPRVIRIARARARVWSGVRPWKIVYGRYFGIAEGVRAVPAGRYDCGGCLADTHVQNLHPPFLFLARVSPPSGKVLYSPGRQGSGAVAAEVVEQEGLDW